jgi:3-oxoacyl-[acyl-carrier-protein] synthase-3
MRVTIPNVFVHSIATALPSKSLDLAVTAEKFGATEVQRIIKDTGISKVRLAGAGVCASDLCEKAAAKVLSESAAAVEGIVFVSQTPDYILPATSALLQHRLGLAKDVVAFDINYGCSGYIYGIYQAALLISSGSCNTVLVCVGDVISRFVNPADRSLRLIMGDAGSATIVTKGSDQLSFNITTDGSGAHYLMIPAGGSRYPKDNKSKQVIEREHGNFRSDEDFFMDGMEIMKFALRDVPKVIDDLLLLRKWKLSEVDLIGFHQANKFIIEYLIKKMRLSKEAVPIAVGEIGNTGGASIPAMLTLEWPRLLAEKRLGKAILCGFGTGLSCAAVALDLSQTKVFEAIEVP